jgi:Tol biopolymer transport system component
MVSGSHAAYPGRNGHIGFVGGRGAGYGETFRGVWMISPAGGAPTRVPGISASAPPFAFSPDGKQIAYAGGPRALYVATIRTGRTHPVTTKADARLVRPFEPAWSPRGDWLAFAYRDGIAVTNLDGTGLHMICHHCDSALSWSRHDRIAYVHNGSLYSISAKGGRARLLNRYVGPWLGDDDPDWSPDGRRVAFDQNGAGDVTNLFTVKDDGTGLQQLTNSAQTDSLKPAYSPDGRQIVYYAASFQQLWLMNANGSDAHPFPIRGFDPRQPDWQPLPGR